jgi:hypothetical protein
MPVHESNQVRRANFCPVRHGSRGTVNQITDLVDLHRLLRVRLGCEQRGNKANSENDREPDQPHRHLDGGWLAGSLAGLNYGRRARSISSHAARCVACQGVRSHPVPVALVGECSVFER